MTKLTYNGLKFESETYSLHTRIINIDSERDILNQIEDYFSKMIERKRDIKQIQMIDKETVFVLFKSEKY